MKNHIEIMNLLRICVSNSVRCHKIYFHYISKNRKSNTCSFMKSEFEKQLISISNSLNISYPFICTWLYISLLLNININFIILVKECKWWRKHKYKVSNLPYSNLVEMSKWKLNIRINRINMLPRGEVYLAYIFATCCLV